MLHGFGHRVGDVLGESVDGILGDQASEHQILQATLKNALWGNGWLQEYISFWYRMLPQQEVAQTLDFSANSLMTFQPERNHLIS